MIQIRVDEANNKLKNAFADLSEEQTRQAIARAINRTLERGKNKYLKQAIRDEFVVTASDISTNLKIFTANKNNLQGTVNASRNPISITHFKPKFEYDSGSGKNVLSIIRKKGEVIKKETRRKGTAVKGVSIEIKPGKRQTLPFAFMIRGGNNDNIKPVFGRGKYQGGFLQRHTRQNKSGSDTPIQKIFTSSISGMANNPDVKQKTMVDLTPEYEKRLLHEINFITRKFK